MKKYLFSMMKSLLIALGLFSLMTLVNCSSDDDSTMSRDEFVRRLENRDFPIEIQDKKDLPDWLAERITQAEESHNNGSIPFNMYILRFYYQGQTYYIISSTYTARTIYNAQGEVVFFTEDNWEEKCTGCVYIYLL